MTMAERRVNTEKGPQNFQGKQHSQQAPDLSQETAKLSGEDKILKGIA